jgi:hypothetical protein
LPSPAGGLIQKGVACEASYMISVGNAELESACCNLPDIELARAANLEALPDANRDVDSLVTVDVIYTAEAVIVEMSGREY